MKSSLIKNVFPCLLVMICFHFPSFGQTQVDGITSATALQMNFDSEIATQQYLDQLTPEQKERSDAYFEGGYWIMLWEFVIEIAIALIFLFGLSKWIRRITARAKKTSIQNLIYIALYLIIAFLIAFPLSMYTGFFREHQYGMSNMNFSAWLSEELLGFVISLISIGLLSMVLYLVMKKIPERWWILGSGVVIVFMAVGMLISPVFISPLFNEYKPLEEGKIKEDILSLARANGVPVTNVYQFNASKQTTQISANVSGIGSTIRISLNDNLLNKCTPAEIKSVMAHEMGHYVLNHTLKLLIYLSLVIILGFAFINWLMKKAITRFGSRWGISNLSDINSLPLLILLFSFYLFLATPVINTIIRTTESEADIFGLNAAGEPDGFASISMKLSEYRKINPGKWEEMILFDHPSGKARVRMSMEWKAEHLDQ
jgi:STE24 endopeptidase